MLIGASRTHTAAELGRMFGRSERAIYKRLHRSGVRKWRAYAGTCNRPDSLDGEEWKPAVGHEAGYLVSNLGRVFSCKTGRILRPCISHTGHLRINLARHTTPVHRMVLLAFVGPCPEGMECCHNNGIAHDNRLSNLRWDTSAANQEDRRKHGTMLIGERSSSARFTERDVCRFMAMIADGLRVNAAAIRSGIGVCNGYAVTSGRSWGHLWQQ